MFNISTRSFINTFFSGKTENNVILIFFSPSSSVETSWRKYFMERKLSFYVFSFFEIEQI